MLQFFDGNKHDPHPHQRTSSSSSLGSLSNLFSQDKRQYDKQPTRHRIGQKFRNSWVRRDGDNQKSVKKSNSLVIITFSFTNAYFNFPILEALLSGRTS